MASIDAPTIVISGELDQVDRVATLQAELLPRIPHAAMHILPGTGHLSPLEAPAEVATSLRASSRRSRRSAVCSSPGQVPAAFDAALNAGDLDALLGTLAIGHDADDDGEVVQESPDELRSRLAGCWQRARAFATRCVVC